MKANLKNIALALAVGFASAASAQVSITLSSLLYEEDFNTWEGTSGTIPANWDLSATGTIAYQGTGDGTSGDAGFWAFGSPGERSMGVLTSVGTGDLIFEVTFINNTGNVITEVELQWDNEQWRYENEAIMAVSGTGGLNVDFFGAGEFWASSTGTNGDVTVTPTSFQLFDLNIADGETMGLRWTTINDLDPNSGIALNNFQASFFAVPEPTIFSLLFIGALGLRLITRKKSV